MSHLHVPDGVLPLWLVAAGWIAALALIALSSRLSRNTSARRRVPLLAVVSALMLVAMSSEIVPIAYHINFTVVAGAILGPVLAPIAAFITVTMLALLGHGGVTVIGLNTLIITAEMVLGSLLFRTLAAALGRRRAGIAGGIATVLTLATTTAMLVGIVWLGGGGAATVRETGALDPSHMRFANPLSGRVFSVGLFGGGEKAPAGAGQQTLSVSRFAAVVFTIGPIGWLLEALVSGLALSYIARVRPTLLWSGTTGRITDDPTPEQR
jgi:cobalt/nickel transport system permease protein